MKFKDLIKFIESEVEQVAAKPAQEVQESTTETDKPVQSKPIVINIKREEKPKREKDLEEMDFEEIMFRKLDESALRKRIKKMLSEDILAMPEVPNKTNPKSVNQDELNVGIRIELESNTNPITAKEIAVDHLTQNPNYYTDLKTNGGIAESANAAYAHEIYHDSFTQACQEAIDYASKKGYKVDDSDWFTQVSTGPRKPSPGGTNRYSVEVTRMGFPSNKKLHFQVYGMESGKYELNAYLQ